MTQLKPTCSAQFSCCSIASASSSAGVYSIIGSAAGLAGQGVWLSFVLAAFVALLTGFSYAEMATSFPHAGAEYIYARRAFDNASVLLTYCSL